MPCNDVVVFSGIPTLKTPNVINFRITPAGPGGNAKGQGTILKNLIMAAKLVKWRFISGDLIYRRTIFLTRWELTVFILTK